MNKKIPDASEQATTDDAMRTAKDAPSPWVLRKNIVKEIAAKKRTTAQPAVTDCDLISIR
jgi:hypothetical protein